MRSEKISDKLRYDENDLEQELAINLKKHGIAFTRQFKVPTQTGKERIVDLYISAPIRAFIEIKLVPTDIDGNPVDMYPPGSGLSFPSRMERQIKDLYFRFFDKSITCILVTNVKFHKMMEEQLQDTEWWTSAKPHPGLRAFFAKHLKIAYEMEDLTRGFMVPSRGRPKGANAFRNSVVLKRMSELVDKGNSIAESSRMVSQELGAGKLEPLTLEILEPKTIANLWTTHQKNQSLDDD